MRHSKVFRSFYCRNTNDNKGFLWRISRILNALEKGKKKSFQMLFKMETDLEYFISLL